MRHKIYFTAILFVVISNFSCDSPKPQSYYTQPDIEQNNSTCEDLKAQALNYLKENWTEINQIYLREEERSENEDTKSEITVERIKDLASSSAILLRLSKLQNQLQTSCPKTFQEYSIEAAAFMISNWSDNR